jgi:hypothetical protein
LSTEYSVNCLQVGHATARFLGVVIKKGISKTLR